MTTNFSDELSKTLVKKVKEIGGELQLWNFPAYYIKIPHSNITISFLRINDSLFYTVVSATDQVVSINIEKDLKKGVECFLYCTNNYQKLIQEQLAKQNDNQKETATSDLGNEKLN